jgi:hypothetical protein
LQQYLPAGISVEIASTATVRPKILVSATNCTSDDGVIASEGQADAGPGWLWL